MRAHIEWLCDHVGIGRIYEDANTFQNRDPYRNACVVRLDGDEAELMALAKRPTKEEYRTACLKLEALGYRVTRQRGTHG